LFLSPTEHLPIALYGCETWPFILTKQLRIRESDNKQGAEKNACYARKRNGA